MESDTFTYLTIHLREGKKEHTQQMKHIQMHPKVNKKLRHSLSFITCVKTQDVNTQFIRKKKKKE